MRASLGTDFERRKTALWAAVDAKRLSVEYVSGLLPAPPANLAHVAGLLESDGLQPGPDQPSLSERLRGLAATLRQQQVEEEQRQHASPARVQALRPPVQHPPKRRQAA